jgi:hypothetical protein
VTREELQSVLWMKNTRLGFGGMVRFALNGYLFLLIFGGHHLWVARVSLGSDGAIYLRRKYPWR